MVKLFSAIALTSFLRCKPDMLKKGKRHAKNPEHLDADVLLQLEGKNLNT
jgi:hypothetical protein